MEVLGSNIFLYVISFILRTFEKSYVGKEKFFGAYYQNFWGSRVGIFF